MDKDLIFSALKDGAFYARAYRGMCRKYATVPDGLAGSIDLIDAAIESIENPEPEVQEPEIDDSVHCCPDCERPNQFGEVCDSCRVDRGLEELAREDSVDRAERFYHVQ
jgi:hypothetical protein